MYQQTCKKSNVVHLPAHYMFRPKTEHILLKKGKALVIGIL
jgi:hypothetical protein